MAQNSNAVPKQLKPFVKGDPRINRKGRPRVSDELRDLFLDVLHERATTKDGAPVVVDGHVATNVELIVRQMIRNPKQFEQVLTRAFGKVPDQTIVNGQISTVGLTLEQWRAERDKRESAVAATLADFDEAK